MSDRIPRKVAAGAAGVMTAAMVWALSCAVLSLPREARGLADAAAAELPRSGATNPVTAVLLNYRGYDTLLEIAVLWLAVLAARALVGEWIGGVRRASERGNPVLRGFIRVLLPITMLVAGHFLWIGGHAPGGAFQAGAVLASAGVLLFLGGLDWSRKLPPWAERLLLTMGLGAFLVVGLCSTLLQGRFLEYPPRFASWLMLVIEAPAGLSIAAALVAIFLGGRLRTRRMLNEELMV